MFEILHSGELYLPLDPAILAEQRRRMELVCEYNQTRPSEQAKRDELLPRMLAEAGEGPAIGDVVHGFEAIEARDFPMIDAKVTLF